jgi:glycosyltransferase involved in cell wall biosynthesis
MEPEVKLAFFDDYADERGHHPDYIMGLALAANTPVYCPATFLDGRPERATLVHRPVVGDVERSPVLTRANLQRVYEDAERLGVDVLVNMFLDENRDAFPIERRGVRLAHVLHRPARLSGTIGGVNATKHGDAMHVLKGLAVTDLVIVHTEVGAHQVAQWIPRGRIVHLGWPAATVASIRRRFMAPAGGGGNDEPYVLLIGEALEYKGIHVLLEAVNPGHSLRIAGNLAVGDAAWLAREFPRARVTWEPGWVDRERLDELITGAAVVAFPYLRGFDVHGGVSGALVHAMTFAKPIVVSRELLAQVPDPASCLVVPTGDAIALRAALDRAMARPDDFRQTAGELEECLIENHSYERHLERLIDRLAAPPA